MAGLVENMSGFSCPHCGQTTEIFGHGGGQLLAEVLELPFLGSVPLEPKAVTAADQGRTLIQDDPQSEFAAAIQAIADQL